ncbi:MAG: hypothetical protein D6806_11280, partial [Deltaproteobacteria bacterium]
TTTAASTAKQTVSEKAKVEFFIMSKCPFGVRVMDAIVPVLEKMGGNVDFTVDFIGNVQGEKLSSMHGDDEVKGDKIELCVQKHFPDKFYAFLKCFNKDWRNIPKGWDSCAGQVGIDKNKLGTCYEGEEGKKLLKASFEKARSRGARGSPTMYFGGKPYRGGRSEKAFTRAICNAFPKDKPEICSNIPPPAKFEMVILSDKRCRKCRTQMMKAQMQSMFPGANIKIVDWSTDEGQQMFKEYGLSKLPVIFFGDGVEKAENYPRFQRYLKDKGKWKLIDNWARFDPTKEVCDNKADDDHDGKTDCDDSDCKYAAACRKEEKNKLEVFVMSQCPFGVRALDSMKEVLKAFENKINFEVHYIASANGDGFRSLHGPAEVDEDIRELCAIKYYKKNYKFMDYIWCRNKNIRSTDWKACTSKETGIDAAKIEKCATSEEGKNLLREDIKIAEGMDVSGSPTWYVNNKYRFSGLDPETIKTNFCRYNKLPGCEKKLSGRDQVKAPKGSCGQ